MSGAPAATPPTPITDADLDALEVQMRTQATEPETANFSAQLGLVLIMEIRRLSGALDDRSWFCPHCQREVEPFHGNDGPAEADGEG